MSIAFECDRCSDLYKTAKKCKFEGELYETGTVDRPSFRVDYNVSFTKNGGGVSPDLCKTCRNEILEKIIEKVHP